MQELNAVVMTALNNMAANGTIKEIITKKVEKTVESVLDDALKDWSEFGKELKKAVKEGLAINVQDLNIPQYNQFLLAIVRTKLQEQLDIVGRENIERSLEELLGYEVPKKMKLSKVIEGFKEFVRRSTHGDYDDEITVRIKKSKYGSWWVSLDPRSGESEYSCKYRFSINEENGRVYSMHLDGKDVNNTLFLGEVDGFHKTLFNIYAAATEIEVDHEQIDIYQPEYDEY